MNKKISLGITISLIAIGCAITFVLTWTVSLSIYNSKIAGSEKFDGVYEKLKEMDGIVRANYIQMSSVKNDQLENAILNGYVSGMNDQYAYYMPPSTYFELQQTTSGVVDGAGFEAEPDGSGYLKITRIYKGGSAESNGVQAGDMITEIDGRSLLSMDESTAQGRLSGATGTTLSLRLVRDGELFNVTLIRQQIDIESVTREMLENDIGYIRVTSFNAKTSDQFSSALDYIKQRGAKALIIDIRHNGGGLVSVLKPMLNRLIPAAVVATAEAADGARRTLIETDSEESLDIPIVVLVDGSTASASEIFAVALRDEQGARLIGTQTYGKAVIQSTYEFSDGSALTIPTASIIPSKSSSYNGVGLKPDFVVELPEGVAFDTLTRESDTQLQKALEILAPEPVTPEPSESDTSGEQSAQGE